MDDEKLVGNLIKIWMKLEILSDSELVYMCNCIGDDPMKLIVLWIGYVCRNSHMKLTVSGNGYVVSIVIAAHICWTWCGPYGTLKGFGRWYHLVVAVSTHWRHNDAIWLHRTWSTLVQVMAWCHQAPSHYLSQCWYMSEVLKQSASWDLLRYL